MNLELFAHFVSEICVHTPVARGRPLRWIIIANPKAGGFTIPFRWRRHHTVLRSAAEEARAANPSRPDAEPSRTAKCGGVYGKDSGGYDPLRNAGLVPTEAPGHAGRIVEQLCMEAADTPGAFFLLICAGGDGTSLEALSALYAAPQNIRANFAVLRLPMGTGNDGADAPELKDALQLLIQPTRVELTRALRLVTSTEGKGPFLAFNILSVGLDAFVTHMTNKMKGKLPGDSYKLWVDIASLLYDRIYKVGPMEIKPFDAEGKAMETLRETVLLLAVGASGHRTYGSRKKILPDDRNVCLVRQMPLWRKVALKDQFTTGTHIDKKEALLFNAGRVEFRGQNLILAQMDGETVLLETKDFPAAIELSEPVIPVLALI
jgi:diacylglycerol kinase family enzyme